MSELDKLIAQKKKVNAYITQLTDMKKTTLSSLIETRKEIASLQSLIPNYPNSVEIPLRLKSCDEALSIGTKILMDLEAKLPEYEQQVKEIDDLVEKFSASTQQSEDLSPSSL